jgi:hypothetical protein
MVDGMPDICTLHRTAVGEAVTSLMVVEPPQPTATAVSSTTELNRMQA